MPAPNDDVVVCNECGDEFVEDEPGMEMVRREAENGTPYHRLCLPEQEQRIMELEDAGLGEKEAEAWALREDHLFAREIAEMMGVSESAVYAAWRRVKEKRLAAEELVEALSTDV